MQVRHAIGCALLTCSFFLSLAGTASAGTEVSLWHSYTNQPSGQIRFAFDLRNLKRGVFFGSCGPSTRSLQWEYGFELKGKASEYGKDDIELKDANLHPVPLDSGNILVDEKKPTVQIAIKISTNGVAQDFIGNGTYKLRSKL
jgi:hypothetical protein